MMAHNIEFEKQQLETEMKMVGHNINDASVYALQQTRQRNLPLGFNPNDGYIE